eukprot:m.1324797 g.1324797  ORF g.1324797 m.1324797 type:complete len:805 (-) comp24852_c4_seq1:147-2561(-)
MSAPTAIPRGQRGVAPTPRSDSGGNSTAGLQKPTSTGRGQSTPYFSDNKRSEVNELRTTLNSLDVQRDPKKYREACQKVISYMTLGIDVSRLFTEMVMASASEDMVQKKLVYLYLCNYAESHSDLTLLAINTLQKNCRDHNPMVRGLALRSMCSLRVENLVEYVLQPLQDGLRDKSPYVRKTAVMGCVKLFYTSDSVIYECNIPDTLYSMLKDTDPLVVANCVIALEEILASEGGIVLTRDIAHRLLNILKEFTPWCQSVLMTILVRYVPSNEDEVYDILNVIDDRLKDANSGVVMAAARMFLHLTRNMEDMKEDVYDRIKVPLITQMNAGSSELSFAILHHIELLLSKQPDLLKNEYQSFFCRYNEASYVKFKKIEILTSISTEDNVEAIVEELAAYITDVDVEFARRSIQAVGNIAIRHSESAEYIMSMLLLFLDLDTSYVTSGTLVVLQDVLRKYPDLAEQVIPRLSTLATTLIKSGEAAARVALLWLLGEFGDEVEDAPYIVEEMIENVEDESSSAVRLQMLTTTMKLFFMRPPECQKALGSLLEKMIDEEAHMDVHDRALLYYRLLRTNIDEAKRVIASPRDVVSEFAERRSDLIDAVFDEFNSLSVIYHEPADTFVDQRPPYNTVGLSRPRFQSYGADSVSSMAAARAAAVERRDGAAGASSGGAVGNLLDVDMFTDMGNGGAFRLRADAALSPADFEAKWTANEISLQIKDILQAVPNTQDFETLMGKANIKTLATMPPQNGIIKFFMYAQEAESSNYHLLEVIVEIPTRCLTANFKCDDPDGAADIAVCFRSAMSA